MSCALFRDGRQGANKGQKSGLGKREPGNHKGDREPCADLLSDHKAQGTRHKQASKQRPNNQGHPILQVVTSFFISRQISGQAKGQPNQPKKKNEPGSHQTTPTTGSPAPAVQPYTRVSVVRGTCSRAQLTGTRQSCSAS